MINNMYSSYIDINNNLFNNPRTNDVWLFTSGTHPGNGQPRKPCRVFYLRLGLQQRPWFPLVT
jgi:hypothetical protein